MQQVIKDALREALKKFGLTDVHVQLEHPVQEEHGDYATNIALIAAKHLKKPPMEAAGILVQTIEQKLSKDIKISIAKPGFINFTLPQSVLLEKVQQLLSSDEKFEVKARPQRLASKDLHGGRGKRAGQKIMVEYAHPNTHKEMHIGHMRTLITGEAICRLLEATGSMVFRANYQGDIGPHVAKAIWGIKKIMDEKGIELAEVEGWTDKDKAHFLGEGYVKGSQEYEANKEAIDQLNTDLYASLVILSGSEARYQTVLGEGSKKDSSPKRAQNDTWEIYQITRQWSLDYYEDFYKRFYTQFDRLFFESEMVEEGKRIVKENLGKVFVQDNGAIIFPGEKYARLHTRVFITQAGNPTYEGKEMANAYAEYNAFHFDLKIHVVASEQAGYFQVVFKALELIDPEKFENKQHHVSMGMVQLSDRKISSRTGDILTVDWLIDQVKERVQNLVREGKISSHPGESKATDRIPNGDSISPSGFQNDSLSEQVAIGAIKYSVLKVGTTQNVAFDIEKSVSLDGDSGPYLQYTYARTQSVLRKVQRDKGTEVQSKKGIDMEMEELSVLRALYRFDEIVIEAADTLSPHVLAGYLFNLAQKFNLFYQKHKILESEQRELRLALTAAVGNVIKRGLDSLGIQAPERM